MNMKLYPWPEDAVYNEPQDPDFFRDGKKIVDYIGREIEICIRERSGKDNKFLLSIRNFYKDNKFLTRKQYDTMRAIYDGIVTKNPCADCYPEDMDQCARCMSL